MGLNLVKYEGTYFWTGMPSLSRGALTPIFGGDIPPKKDPKSWPLYDGHSWSPVKWSSRCVYVLSLLQISWTCFHSEYELHPPISLFRWWWRQFDFHTKFTNQICSECTSNLTLVSKWFNFKWNDLILNYWMEEYAVFLIHTIPIQYVIELRWYIFDIM
jgi:hypothetical protein